MNKSIEKRILYSFMAITIMVLLCLSFGISYIINDYFWGSKKRELVASGDEIAKNIAKMGFDSPDKVNDYLVSVDYFLKARIWLVDDAQNVVASSMPRQGRMSSQMQGQSHNQGHQQRPMHSQMQSQSQRKYYGVNALKINTDIQKMIEDVFHGHTRTVRTVSPYLNTNVIAIGIPVKDDNDNIIGALMLDAPVENTEKFLQDIYYYIASVGGIAILIILLLTKLLSKHIVKPLILMRESAAQMARGNYSCNLDIKGQDEVADLGHSLNCLCRDLAKFVEQTSRIEQIRRDFVANVSHELRTPLTIIRGYNEAMLDKTITDDEKICKYQMLIRDETVRLEALIREFLDISRLQAGVEELKEVVPLDIIVNQTVEKLLVKANERDIKLKAQCQAACKIKGSGDRLLQLVMILVDNAIKYGKVGGSVTIDVQKEDGKIALSVQDDGIGIAPDEQIFVWERFYKVDKSHAKAVGGSGLGLAIAKEIIQLHNAQVNLQSELGVGTKITIIFDNLEE